MCKLIKLNCVMLNKNIISILFIMLFQFQSSSQNKVGRVVINFPNNTTGDVVLKAYQEKNDRTILCSIDSSKIIENKYVYSYNMISKPFAVYIYTHQKDSLPKQISVKNPMISNKIRSGNIYLDNSSVTIRVDSLYSKQRPDKLVGIYSGSIYLDMSILLSIDKYIEHKYTNSEGRIVNFEIIKQFPNSLYLLQSIDNSRTDYSNTDSLKYALTLFDIKLHRTIQWSSISKYIESQKRFRNVGINKNFEFYDTKNQKYDFQKFLSGKKLGLLIFWASWCAPCRAEIPKLKELYLKFDEKISFASISIDTNKEQWINAVRKDNVNWPSLSNFNSKIKVNDIFGINSVPFFIVVDRNSKVLYNTIGGQTGIRNVSSFVSNYLANE